MWIVSYPLLVLIGVPSTFSVILALALGWLARWCISITMKSTLAYERKLSEMPMLADIYEGNVQNFYNRLSLRMTFSRAGSCYLALSTIVVIVGYLRGDGSEWLSLLFLALFTVMSVARSGKIDKMCQYIESNPTPEACMEVATGKLRYDYAGYCEAMAEEGPSNYLSGRPRSFRAFQVASMVFAAICCLLGVGLLILGSIGMFSHRFYSFPPLGSYEFLFGSLALYYGVADFYNINRFLRQKK